MEGPKPKVGILVKYKGSSCNFGVLMNIVKLKKGRGSIFCVVSSNCTSNGTVDKYLLVLSYCVAIL